MYALSAIEFLKCNCLFISLASAPDPCLSARGKFRRNRAPCAARAACASMRPVAYAYTPSGRSPAQPAATGFGVPGWRRRNLPPMAPRVFVAPATGLGLAPAPRAAAPVAFAAFRVAMLRRLNTTSSPRGELRRACGEPCRRVSLSSALDPSRRFLRIPIWCASSAPFCAASPSAEPLSVWRERGAGSAASEDARVCRRRRCHARSQWYQQRHGRLNQVYCLGKDAQTRATETERQLPAPKRDGAGSKRE